jgi:predicted anti-sigma-YlaC factor YlaD
MDRQRADCRQVAERTADYLDGRLMPVTDARVALHLVSCAGCRAYVRQMAVLRQAISSLPRHTPTPINRLKLRQQFAAAHSH